MATKNSKVDIEKFFSQKFWEELCPHLTISSDTLLSGSTRDCTQPRRESDWEQSKELINEDGYFVYESWFEPEFIDGLAECFEKLQNEKLLPVFCFVYDEFWELFLHLEPLLTDLVDEYWLLPAVWAWHVTPEKQTAFSPHRDQVRDADVDDDDHLDYLTIWIPLTDLNHLSSSICVLPASLDPDYDADTAAVRVEDLQNVRSLQGPRGSVFCWTTGLAHWGTRQSDFGPPRVSVGLYIQNPEAECLDPPPMDFSKPFSLEQRLSLIGQQIIDYARDADPELLEFASALCQRGSRDVD